MVEFYSKQYDEVLTKFGSNSTEDLDYLLLAIKKNNLNVDIKLITKAFDLSYKLNKDKKRVSGAPYYIHTLSVALIIIEELKIGDTAMLITALLHNVLRDYKEITLPYIRSEFGQKVALLLTRLTRIVKYKIGDKTNVEGLRLLFLLLIKDARIFVLQICNRLHDVRTLKYLPEASQKAVAEETLKFYIPLVNKFGLFQIQRELEERSFYFYDSTQYKKNIDFLKVKKRLYSENIYIIMDYIQKILNIHKIKNNIKIEYIKEYKLFLQINSTNINTDNLFSINVVIEDSTGLNDVFNIIAEELSQKKYVDINYNSIIESDNSLTLETYTNNGKVSVNIKTKEMQEYQQNQIFNQIGDQSIKFYDLHYASQITDADIKLWDKWMQYVINNYSSDNAEKMIWESLRNNLYDKKIIIKTNNNKKVILPAKATAIDLAFNLSESIGLTAITCKINGTPQSLFTELKNGDAVDILTSPNCKPDSSWLNYVISFKSIAYLTNYFKNKQISPNSKKQFDNKETLDYQKIIITSKVRNIVADVKEIIGQDNITRITFANNVNNFIIACQTNIDANIPTNRIFADLMKIKGIKKIDMKHISP